MTVIRKTVWANIMQSKEMQTGVYVLHLYAKHDDAYRSAQDIPPNLVKAQCIEMQVPVNARAFDKPFRP